MPESAAVGNDLNLDLGAGKRHPRYHRRSHTPRVTASIADELNERGDAGRPNRDGRDTRPGRFKE